jgi:blue copper oxidase
LYCLCSDNEIHVVIVIFREHRQLFLKLSFFDMTTFTNQNSAQFFLSKWTFIILLVLCFSKQSVAQYNDLWIPEALSGTDFSLDVRDTFKQIITDGNQTITIGINGDFWGPTLFLQKGETVHMNVTNHLNDSTTVHWHGMHLPAVMDGGPHQVIPPGANWQPFWNVTNNAGTYWYHPHLHEMTTEQIVKGMGGFIIVQDDQEAALDLPRTYGVDDFPLALTSRKYDGNDQFVSVNTAYGDYMLTNGVPNAQVALPKQMVRLRILNVEVERGYDLGFSDNRNFSIIANDGGLLDAPVVVNRVKLMVGERVEILVDLSADAIGSELDLKAFNSNQAFGFPGGEPNAAGQFGSLLNNIDFPVLHIQVAAPTANPINAVPSSLANNTYWTSADATVNRAFSVTGGQGPVPFTLNNTPFALDFINHTVDLNAIEKWTVTNNNIFGHTFHIHDVQFKIVARNGNASAVGAHESGWKDVMYVPRNESVAFVTKFEDYADQTHPFMYHCHFTNHEDGGMMGQFVVNGPENVSDISANKPTYSVFPNPTNDRIFIQNSDPTATVYYVRITTPSGRTVRMLPQPELQHGIDVSDLAAGFYLLEITDKLTKHVDVQKVIIK